jgi:lipid A ethanolaminephosphotransferase
MTNNFFNKLTISRLYFIVIYTIYSYVIFNIPLFKNFFKVFQVNQISDYMAIFGLLFITFGLTLILFLVILQKRLIKFLSILFLLINSLLLYFMLEYQVPINDNMINNALYTNSQEAFELFSFKLIIFFFVFGIVPSLIIIFTKIEYKKFSTIKIIAITLAGSLLLLFVNYSKFALFFRINRGLNDFHMPFNYLTPITLMIKESIVTQGQKEEIEITDLTLNNKKNINIVLIVGETARKKNFELYGYERKNNPNLSKIEDLKVLPAISCGTSTYISVPCIFEFKKGYKSYLKPISDAGAFVKWYENNYGGCYSACNGVETFKTNHSKCKDQSCYDEIIFNEFYKDLEKKKNEKGPKLFVLHQNGSHGPLYYKRYPSSFAKFEPECKISTLNKCSREELVNSYDNTILYTDFLIANTIEHLKKLNQPSILFFI